MSHILAPVFSKLFILSIMEGVFPSYLKIGRVRPMFKSGKKYEITKYRQITTLPVLAKILEKIAHKRMIYFVNRFSLLNTKQFRFLAGQNTASALTNFSDKAYDAINQDLSFINSFF